MTACIMNGKRFVPIEFKVLVKPDLIEETDELVKRCKALNMELPPDVKERDKLRQITGTLIAVGGNAFDDFKGQLPSVGDKVYFAKYAGLMIQADDKTEFRLMNDKDITGLLVE
jgi:co-chaperonin GroES (HSP10)